MGGQGIPEPIKVAAPLRSVPGRIRNALETRSVKTVIGLALVVKAVILFLIIPQFSAFLSPFYGVSFADDYDKLAWNIVLGNGYRFFPDTAVTLMREPGYPLFLSAIFKFFGYSLTAARAANFVLAGATAFVLARLASTVTQDNKLVVVLAPILFLFHPGILVAESRGGVEVLFVFCLVAFLLVLYLAINKQTIGWWALVGMMLGITLLVRSTLIVLPVFLLLYSLLSERRVSHLVVFRNVAVMASVMAIVIAPWVIRNWQVAHVFMPTASVKGVAAQVGQYICSNITFSNGFQQLDIAASEERSRLAAAIGYRFKNDYYQYFYRTQDELAFNKLLWDRTVAGYIESPVLFLRCAVSNMFNFWFAGKNWLATALNFAVQAPYLLLAGLGISVLVKTRRLLPIGPLLLMIVYFIAIYVPIHAQARYSTPIIPIISILAAIAVARWLRFRFDIKTD